MNRRNRLRFSTDMIATVTGLEEFDISMKGRLANLSAHGISLILPDTIPSGITVKVEWGTSHVIGRLKYCKPYRNEYRAGIEVHDPIYDAGTPEEKDRTPDPIDLEIIDE
jgi:hypothetical protein